MNYYEHHLGDYLRDTAHLSMVEDGAYRRLLDAYYIRERALPTMLRDVFRLVRAQSKQDREAVETVLREFFEELPEGWRHSRCDYEVARFQDKQRKAKASADARWSKVPSQSDGNANASAISMRSHSDGNAPTRTGARPSPVPSNQTPDTRLKASTAALPASGAHAPDDPPPEAAGHSPTPAGAICRAMRKAGMASTNPGDPRLLALIAQGATEAEFEGLAAEAVAKEKGFAWVLSVLPARRAEAATIHLAKPIPATVPSAEGERTQAYLAEQFRKQTPEEKAKADEARKRAMAALGRSTGT